MIWLKRIAYYSIGLIVGSFIVYFIWSNKEVSFDYGMDARTLKTIRVREKSYTEDALKTLKQNNLDTIAINHILQYGDVNFNKSKQHEKPCAQYWIEGEYQHYSINFWVSRCDSIATISKIDILKRNN